MKENKMLYTVKKATAPVLLNADFDNDSQWRNANIARLDYILRQDTDYVGKVSVKMLYDTENIYGLFKVEDQYIRVVHSGYQQMVCEDSCVEFFVQPSTDYRYFNFEISGGGAMLLWHVKDCDEENYTPVSDEDCETIERFHTLPDRVEPEITTPLTCFFGFRIPISFFVKYSGINPDLSGQVWRGNFSKCGDNTSHPYWLTWVEFPRFSFHIPEYFGKLVFE